MLQFFFSYKNMFTYVIPYDRLAYDNIRTRYWHIMFSYDDDTQSLIIRSHVPIHVELVTDYLLIDYSNGMRHWFSRSSGVEYMTHCIGLPRR